MSNSNKDKIITNVAFIGFNCYFLENPADRIKYGHIQIADFSIRNKNYLTKKGNIWYLKISIADKSIIKLLSNSEIITYINLYCSYTHSNSRYIGIGDDCIINKLLYKEHYNLLIEMSPQHVYEDKFQFQLILTLEFDSNSDIRFFLK